MRCTHLTVKVLFVLEVCEGELLALLTSSADLFLSGGGVMSSGVSTPCLPVTRFIKHLAAG